MSEEELPDADALLDSLLPVTVKSEQQEQEPSSLFPLQEENKSEVGDSFPENNFMACVGQETGLQDEQRIRLQINFKLEQIQENLDKAIDARVVYAAQLIKQVLLEKKRKWVTDFEKFLKVRMGLRQELGNSSGAQDLMAIAEHLYGSPEMQGKYEAFLDILSTLGAKIEAGPDEGVKSFFNKSLSIEYTNTERKKERIPEQVKLGGGNISRIEKIGKKRDKPLLVPRPAPEPPLANIPFPYSFPIPKPQVQESQEEAQTPAPQPLKKLAHIFCFTPIENSKEMIFTQLPSCHNSKTILPRFIPAFSSFVVLPSAKAIFVCGGTGQVKSHSFLLRVEQQQLVVTEERAPIDPPRRRPALACHPDGSIIFASGGFKVKQRVNFFGVYQLLLNIWTPLQSMRSARDGHCLICVHNGLQQAVYAIGGTQGGIEDSNIIERYDRITQNWTICSIYGLQLFGFDKKVSDCLGPFFRGAFVDSLNQIILFGHGKSSNNNCALVMRAVETDSNALLVENFQNLSGSKVHPEIFFSQRPLWVNKSGTIYTYGINYNLWRMVKFNYSKDNFTWERIDDFGFEQSRRARQQKTKGAWKN